MVFKGKKFSAERSLKVDNSVCNFNNKYFIIRKILRLDRGLSTNEIVLANRLTVVQLTKDIGNVLRVNRISPTVQIIKCTEIRSDKFLTLFSKENVMTHICKLLNTIELE